MSVLVTVVVITVLISASCSLYEAVLYSTRRGTLESAKNQAKRSAVAKIFIKMKDNISEPIAAILILNTLANTAGASIAGMYATEILGPANVPVFSFVFTILILFLAEIGPKTVGAVHWKKLWPLIVYPLIVMKKLLYPLILMTEKFTRMISTQKKTSTITEDELLALIHLGAREGEISHDESRMVRNIINLEEKKVTEVMTPRRVIFSIDVNSSLIEVVKAIQEKGFSRIPVFEGDRENIIGYALAKDIFALHLSGRKSDSLRELVLPIHTVSNENNCLSLLNHFLKYRKHIAIVSDEYGGLDGLVSLEDLLETMLGAEIVDETDRVIDLQEEARKDLKKK